MSKEEKDLKIKIINLWRDLPEGEKEGLVLRLLRDTELGRKMPLSSCSYYAPHYMWEPKK